MVTLLSIDYIYYKFYSLDLSTCDSQAAFVLPLIHPRDMDIGLCEESTQGPSSSSFLITLEVPVGTDGEPGDIATVLGMNVIPGQAASSTYDITSR